MQARNLRRRFRRWYRSLPYLRVGGYCARRYWQDRLGRFGSRSFRGVGHKGKTEDENREEYEAALDTVLELCRSAGVCLAESSVGDIGCGIGFYAQGMTEAGVRRYVGYDITGVLFADLRNRFPQWQFRALDVTECELPESHDVILMIDVTQHITSERHFRFAMRNVQRHLNPGGVFLVTSWLQPKSYRTFYECTRDLDDYRRCFEGWAISDPVRFRDKYLFSISDSRRRDARGKHSGHD